MGPCEKPMPKRLSILDADRCVGCMSCMFACARRLGRGGLAGSCIAVHSAGGMRKGFVVIVCRACPDPPCARACPTQALSLREGGGVRLEAALCDGCRACVVACPFGAVAWDEEQKRPDICVYCGICAHFCPYGVIGLEEISAEARP